MILGLSATQWLVIGIMLVLIAALAWTWLAGDREGEMVDEPPVLNTRGDE